MPETHLVKKFVSIALRNYNLNLKARSVSVLLQQTDFSCMKQSSFGAILL
jgi:hypothetical protein